MANIFAELQSKVKANKTLPLIEREAWMFFKTYANELNSWQHNVKHKADWATVSGSTFSKKLKNAGASFPGECYFFMYDPKLRQSLPHYDAFPFVLVLDRGPGWFFGLNFHYLNYDWRARFFDALYTHATDTNESLKAKIEISYDILQTTTNPAVSETFRPCLKKYLTKHVQTPLLQVGADYWHIALFLPVEQFKKASAGAVWRNNTPHGLPALPMAK